MFIFNLSVIFIFGLCFGSFISMASYRFAYENITIKDFILKNSFCPSCNNKLRARHLFPLFSWLLYRGKCGFCRQKISVRYPLIEIATALIFMAIFVALGATVDAKLILTLLMAVTLIIMVVVDLENYFIPDFTQIFLAILALTYHILVPDDKGLVHYLLSAIGFFSFGLAVHFGFLFLTKKQGIGEDDLKFFAIAGLLLGIDQLLIFMILNGLLGGIFGILWMKLKNDDTFPFAPSICSSLLVCHFFKIDYIYMMGTALYWFEKYVLKTAY
jgi:prepilin signal peptidase PulO-like enzyme (type II secretory pathway)